LYAAAAAAFVGGSLVPKGGQNPMEPSLFGIQTTHGPHMDDFPDTARMDSLGAARRVEDADGLARAWMEATDPRERERTQRASQEYFSFAGGAAQRAWSVIESRARLGERVPSVRYNNAEGIARI
jgi:3-deoxy-D-manno-octulosonic-acid transferase